MNAGSAGTNSWRGTTRPRPSNIAVGKLFSRKFSSRRRSRQELPRRGPSQLQSQERRLRSVPVHACTLLTKQRSPVSEEFQPFTFIILTFKPYQHSTSSTIWIRCHNTLDTLTSTQHSEIHCNIAMQYFQHQQCRGEFQMGDNPSSPKKKQRHFCSGTR